MLVHVARSRNRPGITLTEILIAIMILGVGMVSLATLFPVGLLKLRDATRYSRTAYLVQSAAGDVESRGLLNKQSFGMADMLNAGYFPFWYATSVHPGPNQYDPFTQDTDFYGGTVYTSSGALVGVVANPGSGLPVANLGSGLPVAYDPLWRYQTGVYLDPLGQTMPEARFASGVGFIRSDPSDGKPASVYGLQRLTNFNRPSATTGGATYNIMNSANNVPSIFVSPEDLVLNEQTSAQGYSPLIPDLNLPSSLGSAANDWRYSWMFTGLQTNTQVFSGGASPGSTFDGNLVIWENRPFGIEPLQGPYGGGYKVDGETVVEAVFGYSTNVTGTPGYGLSSDRTVLLRWPASQTDLVVKSGDWIADVTYERSYAVASSRFQGAPNPAHNNQFDNLPAQRCYWYQVTRATAPGADPTVANYRYMIVAVSSSLQARTLMTSGGWQINAALIARNVINVIPQTFFVR